MLWSAFCPSPRPPQPRAKFQTSKQKRRWCRDGEGGGLLWGTGAGAGTQRRRDTEQNRRQQPPVSVRLDLHGWKLTNALGASHPPLCHYLRWFFNLVSALCFVAIVPSVREWLDNKETRTRRKFSHNVHLQSIDRSKRRKVLSFCSTFSFSSSLLSFLKGALIII